MLISVAPIQTLALETRVKAVARWKLDETSWRARLLCSSRNEISAALTLTANVIPVEAKPIPLRPERHRR
jgi:hypothetical protein